MKFNRSYIAAAIAASMALAACSKGDADKSSEAVKEQAEELQRVEVREVRAENVDQTASYTATVEADKTNNISSSTPNRIKTILVDVGSRVAAGQKVAVLDDVNLEQLRVRLENTRRQFERAKTLYEIGGGTLQSMEQLQTEYEASKRQYDNMAENTILRSPISGVVTARNYDPGDMTSSLPILTVEQINPVKIVLNISETDFSHITGGMSADVTLDSRPGEEFTGKVSLIHPRIDAATRTFPIEVTLANPDGKILPGMFARVTLSYGHAEHVVVPDRAVVKQSGSGNRYVYVYNPATSTVSYNRVELGRRLGDSYEIISGVEPGSLVVVAGQTRLADGVRVTTSVPTAESGE